MKVTSSLLLLVILMLLSCKKEQEAPAAGSDARSRYYRLQNLGWKSRTYTQRASDMTFTATEVPIQYYLLKEKGPQDLSVIDSLYEENKKERIVEFTFAQEAEKDILKKEFTGMKYDDAVKYMAFAIDKDFYVVTSKHDTIACSGANFERTYKITPYQKVTLFFSGIDPNEKLQLVYTDHLFRKGTLKFNFSDTYTEIAL